MNECKYCRSWTGKTSARRANVRELEREGRQTARESQTGLAAVHPPAGQFSSFGPIRERGASAGLPPLAAVDPPSDGFCRCSPFFLPLLSFSRSRTSPPLSPHLASRPASTLPPPRVYFSIPTLPSRISVLLETISASAVRHGCSDFCSRVLRSAQSAVSRLTTRILSTSFKPIIDTPSLPFYDLVRPVHERQIYFAASYGQAARQRGALTPTSIFSPKSGSWNNNDCHRVAFLPI